MVIRLVLLIIVVGIVGYGIREYGLLRKSSDLAKISEQFSTDFYVGNQSDTKITYVVMGDSIGSGTGASKLEATYFYQFAQALANEGKYVHVINIAQYGQRIHGLVQDQASKLEVLKPDIISVTIGANDATHGTNHDQFVADLKSLNGTVKKLPNTMVYMATTPDLSLVPAYPKFVTWVFDNRAKAQNTTLRDIFVDRNIVLVDLFTSGKLDYNQDKTVYAADLFHPGDNGYAKWADVFKQARQKSSVAYQ